MYIHAHNFPFFMYEVMSGQGLYRKKGGYKMGYRNYSIENILINKPFSEVFCQRSILHNIGCIGLLKIIILQRFGSKAFLCIVFITIKYILIYRRTNTKAESYKNIVISIAAMVGSNILTGQSQVGLYKYNECGAIITMNGERDEDFTVWMPAPSPPRRFALQPCFSKNMRHLRYNKYFIAHICI